jgi:hypothetical protein
MRDRTTLPDMDYMRRQIPIADVARELGIRVSGLNAAHCWRVGAHQNGDRSPSLSFRRNRAKCYVCDADSMSTIDLVIRHQEFDPSTALREATSWLCARWPVPTVAKNTKLARRERWATAPVGFSSFPLEEFIRSGVWAVLDDPARAVLPVLFCFAERGTVSVSYRGLARYSGLASFASIRKALQRFNQLGILEALPRVGSNFREPSSYRFTLDSEKFQAALSEIHARLKLESGAERELLAQNRMTVSNPNPHPSPGALYPGTVSTRRVTRTQVHVTPSVACTFSSNSKSAAISEDSVAENKDTCESTRYTTCNTNSELSLNKKPQDIPSASESQNSGIENKTSCASARYTSCNTEESAEENAPAEVTPLVTSQESENPPARWKAPTSAGLSEIELAEKLARSIATARQWSEITGERSR